MKRMHLPSIIAAMLVVLLCGFPSGAFAEDLSVAEAKQFAIPLIRQRLVDGVSVGIIDGSRNLTFHLGEWCPGQGSPNDQTIYEIGSITKVFTGTLLAIEADGDRSFLLDPVNGRRGRVNLPSYQGQPINWLQLATHRSGLPRLPDNLAILPPDNPYVNYDSAKASEFLNAYQLPRRPGTEYEYSNFAFSWLGHLLTEEDGAFSYERLLEKRITRPLRMEDTVLTLSTRQERRMATPHSSVGVVASTWEFADLPGAGGIRSTLADMMKFISAVIDPSEIPSDRRLADGIDLAWSKHQESSHPHFAMGLGWQIARDGETRWHNGQTGGFHSVLFVNRAQKRGVVALANTADASRIELMAENLMRRLSGEAMQPDNELEEIEVELSIMKRLEGRYELSPTFVLDVRVVGNRLMVGVTNQPTHQVFAKRTDRWFYKAVDAELDFDLPAIGPAKSVELIQNGIRQTAVRVLDR